MERLPLDVLEKMSLELSSKDLLNFCKSQSRNDQIRKLCQNENFWRRRFQKDFPKIFEKIKPDSWKKTYLFIVSRLAESSERSTEYALSLLGDKQKYITREYKEYLENYFYNLTLETMNWYIDKIPEEEDSMDMFIDWKDEYRIPIMKEILLDPYLDNDDDWISDFADIIADIAPYTLMYLEIID
jgi:hypothetical protein